LGVVICGGNVTPVTPVIVLQSLPVLPGGQSHDQSKPRLRHIPPFQHGLLKQKSSPFSNNLSQYVPLTPFY